VGKVERGPEDFPAFCSLSSASEGSSQVGHGAGVFQSRAGAPEHTYCLAEQFDAAAQVTDALAGRAPTSAVLGDLPARSRAALSHLADFFNTPVEQPPA